MQGTGPEAPNINKKRKGKKKGSAKGNPSLPKGSVDILPRSTPKPIQQSKQKVEANLNMERAKADAVLASTSSRWYAGAAFDRSPAANTLPRPTRLLSKSPSKDCGGNKADGREVDSGKVMGASLATSCPQSLLLTEHMTVGNPTVTIATTNTWTNTVDTRPMTAKRQADLDEMTLHIRKLLNIS